MASLESYTILQWSSSIFPPKSKSSSANNYKAPPLPLPLPLRPRNPTSSHRSTSTALQCNKMYVPGFGEASPEAKAAKRLHDFFTYIAVRIVIAQLQRVVGNWAKYIDRRLTTAQSYNEEAYADMMKFLENHSLDDGDKFCADLMRESSNHRTLALRILDVRSAYCNTDFEWDNLKRLASKMVEERNTKVMRDYLSETSPK